MSLNCNRKKNVKNEPITETKWEKLKRLAREAEKRVFDTAKERGKKVQNKCND
jgi:hypothetical protein